MRERNLLEDPPDHATLAPMMRSKNSYTLPVSMSTSRSTGSGYEYGAAGSGGRERGGGLTLTPPQPVAGSAGGAVRWGLDDFEDYLDHPYHDREPGMTATPRTTSGVAPSGTPTGVEFGVDYSLYTDVPITGGGYPIVTTPSNTTSSPHSPPSSPGDVERPASQGTSNSTNDSNANSPFGDVYAVDSSVSMPVSGSPGQGDGSMMMMGYRSGGKGGRIRRSGTPPLTAYPSAPAIVATVGTDGVPVPNMTPLPPVRLHSHHSHSRSRSSTEGFYHHPHRHHQHHSPPTSFNSFMNPSNNDGGGSTRRLSNSPSDSTSHSRSASGSGFASIYSGLGSGSRSHSQGHSRSLPGSAHGRESPVVYVSDVNGDQEGDSIPLVALYPPNPNEDIYDDAVHHPGDDDVLRYPPTTGLTGTLDLIQVETHSNQSDVSLSDAVDYSRRVT